MSKPASRAVAAQGIRHVGNSYGAEDCQALIENCVAECGGAMAYAGSNDMARNAAAWLGTLANARAEGRLVPGAGLLIHEEDESGLPARYRGDGLGDFSHIGLYVGDALAFADTDKSGKSRLCDVVHSSASMGRVAGSTLANGWTHVLWFKELDYGAEVAPGVALGTEASAQETAAPVAAVTAAAVTAAPAIAKPRAAVVTSPDGNPVKLRPQPKKGSLYWKVAVGTPVAVERERNGYALLTAVCTDGYTRRAYLQAQFLAFGREENEHV